MLLACPEEGDAQQADTVLSGTSAAASAGSDQDVSSSLPKLPDELVEKMLRDHVIKDLENLHDIFSEVEVRMRGASLLLVYEGEPNRLAKTLSNHSEEGKPQVRLIDFGHATIVPGQGPDKGVLLGLSTVLDLARRQLACLEPKRA